MPDSVDPQPNENELECARCGAIVYVELTRCPECGVNLYEPEAETDTARELEVDSANIPGLFESISQYLRRLFGLAHPAEALFATPQKQARLYANLLGKVGGDQATADRLIELERLRLPNVDRLTWLENAIRRWERDNG